MGKEIASSTLMTGFDNNFHVSAGPGAGKTYWLVRHIRNIQQLSQRLRPSTKILCISYTNIASDQIKEAIGFTADTVDVSTIHNFLFSNVVRPYLHLLRRVDGERLVNTKILDNHLEHRPSYRRVDEWLKSVGRLPLSSFDWPRVMSFLQRVSWRLDEQTGIWTLRANRSQSPGKYFPLTKLDTYKLFYWRDGIVDHDDILYLSHRLLTEHPLLVKFISHRFPYLLVDEFQDTSPVQAAIVKKMAEAGTVVTVVGDAEQAIYSFQGASVEAFLNFRVHNQEELTIAGNRRSTKSIVDFLNLMRRDSIVQHSLRPDTGSPVCVLVGGTTDIICAAMTEITQSKDDSRLAILVRTNAEVAKLRSGSSLDIDSYWASMMEVDYERARFLRSCCEAAIQISDYHISLALLELRTVVRIADGKIANPLRLKGDADQSHRDAIVVAIAKFLSRANREMQSASILSVYQEMSQALKLMSNGLSLSQVRAGKFVDIAQQMTYGSLVSSGVLGDSYHVSTIHKAKGAQFQNVLVFFSKDFSFSKVLDKTCNDEEQRVAYVGLSRAMDHLFIGVPDLTAPHEEYLRSNGCRVERLS